MAVVKTVKVRRKDGHVCLINETDFDPAQHERVDAPQTAPKPAGGAEAAEDDNGAQNASGDDLEALSADDLRALADELGISKSVRRTETLIEKIREARA